MLRNINTRAMAGAVALFCITTMTALAMPARADETVTATRIGPALHHPWGMTLIDADTALITERRGTMRAVSLSTGTATTIANVPPVFHRKQGGLLDVVAHAGWIYLCYAAPLDGGTGTTAIYRARLDAATLRDGQQIFQANAATSSGHHFGCRLEIPTHGPNAGFLFATLGDRGDRETAQNPAIHAGSVIRLHLDGTVPTTNPRHSGWAPEILSIGHRNPQGMAVHPQTGAIWTHEHGPRGGDEINVITAGANYGWPTVSFGREYVTRRRVSDFDTLPGYADPAWVWVPSIAPSGMAFYPRMAHAAPFPDWQGHLLVGSLKFRQLYLVTLDERQRPVAESVVLDQSIGRIRDVDVIPTGPLAGAVLVLTDEAQGGLYILQPAP